MDVGPPPSFAPESKLLQAARRHAEPIAVALTVPHATCPVGVEGHLCDTSAPAAADALFRSLSEAQQFDVTRWDGDVPRTECDLNRGNWCSWKPRLAEWFSQQKGDFWVLDVHSFPPTPGVWHDQTSHLADLVLLDNSPGSSSFYAYNQELSTRLNEQGYQTVVIKGAWDVNDLNAMGRIAGARRVYLLEFNEKLSISKLKQLCVDIVHSIQL